MYLKFATGAVLFIAWVVLVSLKVPLAGDLIDFIKYVLVGLAAHLLTGAGQTVTVNPSPTFSTAPSTTVVTTK
jgi:hypothetical protein